MKEPKDKMEGERLIIVSNRLPFHIMDRKKIITLRILQGRNPNWVGRPFFAEYDENASWMEELKPAFGEKQFFFEKELKDGCKFQLEEEDLRH